MKWIVLIFLISNMTFAQTIKGTVIASELCDQEKAMVWLSLDKKNYQDQLLLSHTMVPVKGSFGFEVKPGKYLVRVTDSKGCLDERKVEIKEKTIKELNLRLSEKK